MRNVNEAANNRVLDSWIEPDPLLDEDSAAGASARERIGNKIHALRLREFRTQGVQLGYRYRQSMICVDDGALEPPDDHMVYHPSTWPGSRAPHAWLAPSRSILDEFGRGFVLLRFNAEGGSTGALTDAAAARRVPLRVITIDSAAMHKLYERSWVIVRPDGHVAWRSDAAPRDPIWLIDRVRGA